MRFANSGMQITKGQTVNRKPIKVCMTYRPQAVSGYQYHITKLVGTFKIKGPNDEAFGVNDCMGTPQAHYVAQLPDVEATITLER
jgi:hypothetical protein